jgi:hypothetical protein
VTAPPSLWCGRRSTASSTMFQSPSTMSGFGIDLVFSSSFSRKAVFSAGSLGVYAHDR